MKGLLGGDENAFRRSALFQAPLKFGGAAAFESDRCEGRRHARQEVAYSFSQQGRGICPGSDPGQDLVGMRRVLDSLNELGG